jgi:hypothetical protein
MSNQFLNEREYSEGFDVSKELIVMMLMSLHFHGVANGLEIEEVYDNVTAGFISLFMTVAKETKNLHGQSRLVFDIENLVEEYNLSNLVD